MNKESPRHAPLTGFPIEDDCLIVGGMALTRLAERVGRTPFYVYDRRLITERVEHLRKFLPKEIHLHYAMKANPMPAVVQHLAGLVDGLDVASSGEMKVALDTPMPPEHISMAGPGKRAEELSSAIAAGILINVESARELDVIARQSERLGYPARVAIRINPAFELKSSGMKMGGGPKQFGVDEELVPDVLRRVRDYELDFHGFHIFSGSQNLRSEAIIEAQKKSIELALRLADHCPSPIRVLNIGGGFGIPYFPGEQALDIAPIGEQLSERLEDIRPCLPNAAVVIELGRYIVGEAGLYVCRVIDRKESRGQVFLVTDGGLHHHLAASGNFGQVIRKNYPVVIGNKVRGTEREEASIVGPLCTPLDILGDRMDLARADIGDLVAVYQSGAYGYTASPTRFLNHPDAVEVLI